MDSFPPTHSYALFVGIDIAARSAAIALRSPAGERLSQFTIKQTSEGMTDLHQRCQNVVSDPHQVRVVMEVTGNYWMELALFLYNVGYVVSAVNPFQAHHFGQASLKRAKTDRIDAQSLAEMASKMDLRLWRPASPIQEQLFQCLVQREYFLEDRKKMKNRLHALSYRPQEVQPVRQRVERSIERLTHEILDIEADVASILDQDVHWSRAVKLLTSITGIGLVTASWLVTATDNFTLCDNSEQLASYIGLVPYPHQSGDNQTAFRRGAQGGNRRLRHILYMATLTAIRVNPIIRAYYRRLVSRGKKGKVACIAAERKLTSIAWAVATRQTPFDPDYQQRH